MTDNVFKTNLTNEMVERVRRHVVDLMSLPVDGEITRRTEYAVAIYGRGFLNETTHPQTTVTAAPSEATRFLDSADAHNARMRIEEEYLRLGVAVQAHVVSRSVATVTEPWPSPSPKVLRGVFNP